MYYSEVDHRRITIVVIENNPLFLAGIGILLSRECDFEVLEYLQNGIMGVQCVKRNHPSIVVLDLGLPDQSGLDVARCISDISPTTRIVVQSIADSKESQAAALSAGASAFVSKNDLVTHLAAAIRRVAYAPVV